MSCLFVFITKFWTWTFKIFDWLGIRVYMFVYLTRQGHQKISTHIFTFCSNKTSQVRNIFYSPFPLRSDVRKIVHPSRQLDESHHHRDHRLEYHCWIVVVNYFLFSLRSQSKENHVYCSHLQQYKRKFLPSIVTNITTIRVLYVYFYLVQRMPCSQQDVEFPLGKGNQNLTLQMASAKTCTKTSSLSLNHASIQTWQNKLVSQNPLLSSMRNLISYHLINIERAYRHFDIWFIKLIQNTFLCTDFVWKYVVYRL